MRSTFLPVGSFFVAWGVLALLSGLGVVRAQEVQEGGDPSDLWLRGYMLMREAETKEDENQFLQALSKYREAQSLFDYIARTHPSWKTNMMNYRRRALLDKIDALYTDMKATDPAKADQWAAENRGGAAEVPGGGRGPVQMVPPTEESPMVPDGGAYAEGSAAAVPAAPMQGVPQEFGKLQDQLDLLTGANQRLRTELGQRTQQMDQLQAQLAQAKGVEQQIQQQLATTLRDLRAAKSEGGDKVQDLEAQLRLATEELRRANSESASILRALESARQEVVDLTEQRDALVADRQGQMEKSSQLLAKMTQAEADRDQARGERDEAKKAAKELEAELEAMRAKAESGGMDGEAMEALREELAAAVKAGESAEAKLAEAERERVSMQAEIAALTQAEEEARESARAQEELIAKLRAELSATGEMGGQNEALLHELEKSQSTIGLLNQKVASLESEAERLRFDNASLVKERDLILQERDQLQQDMDEMAILLNASDQVSGDIKDMLSANQKWRESLDKARDEIRVMAEREGDYQQEIADLKGQLTMIQEERTVLQVENRRYQERVEELTGKLKGLLVELESKTEALESVTGERDRMAAELMTKNGLIAAKDMLVAKLTGKLEVSEEQVAMLASTREENEMLRGIVRRQLVRQARLQQAREMVLDELQRIDVQSATLLTSLDEMAGQPLNLSEAERMMFKEEEELKLIEVVTAEPGTSFSSLPVSGADGAGGTRPEAAAQNPADMIILASRDNDVTRLAKAANYDFSRGDLRNAALGYEKVIAIDRANVFALTNLGVIYLRRGDLADAESRLRQALAHDRRYAPAHYYLGVLFYKNSDYDQALESFDECITLDTSNADAHNYVGLIASMRGWGSRAEREFKQAVVINPGHANAYFNLSVLYATKESPSKPLAEQFYRKAIDNGAARDAALEQFINS